jgi:hypothetical protein
MPELPTLTITAADGTVRDTLTGIRAERDRHVTDRSRARFVLDAARWQTVADSINRRADRFRIDAAGETGWFGGRFRDTERGGQQVTVILDDYERDGRDAQPTGGQVLFQNVDDATVVQDAISRIPTLSAGTIQTVTSGLSFSFSNAEPAKMIRDAAQPGGAIVRYNADRTVDFVARPTTASEPELSTAANTLVGDPDVSDDNRNPATEIIGLGAQSGPNQVRATATVDPTAARDVYRRYENKDIQQQDRLQTTVDRLADEVAAAEEKLDVEADAINLDVRPGDPLAFVWPARGIDETVRVIEFTEVINERGQRYAPLRVSNRWPEQGGSDKAIADLERFNRGYQGFIDRDNFRAVERQPVDGSLAATGEYPYPDDVVTEVTSEITVRSLPYRSYVSSGGHTHTIDIGQRTSLNNAVDINDSQSATVDFAGGGTIDLAAGETVDKDFTIPDGWSAYPTVIELVAIGNDDDPNAPAVGDALAWSFASGSYWSSSTKSSEHVQFKPPKVSAVDALTIRASRTIGDVNPGDNISLFVENISGSEIAFDFLEANLYNIRHTHTVDIGSETSQSAAGFAPGVVESFPDDPGANANGELLASNLDIVINGSTVATDIGSGEFTQTVDISGDLSAGVNDIEITSDTPGLVSAYVQTELFRQVTEDTV